ncbi:MAG TPA: hypothetical protein VGE08_14855, partial [Steroidobacter sp.]
MATSKQPLSLKGRALALLAQREHSEVELRRKLLRHARSEAAAKAVQAGAGASDEQDGAAEDEMARVDAVIDWLRTHNYLSEQRFV